MALLGSRWPEERAGGSRNGLGHVMRSFCLERSLDAVYPRSQPWANQMCTVEEIRAMGWPGGFGELEMG